MALRIGKDNNSVVMEARIMWVILRASRPYPRAVERIRKAECTHQAHPPECIIFIRKHARNKNREGRTDRGGWRCASAIRQMALLRSRAFAKSPRRIVEVLFHARPNQSRVGRCVWPAPKIIPPSVANGKSNLARRRLIRKSHRRGFKRFPANFRVA